MHKKKSLGTFLAHAGVCSRRNADLIVRRGLITLNGLVVQEPGTPVQPTDKVVYQGKLVVLEQKVYILLNKPAGYLSAVSDEERGRKTVIDLVQNACQERLYPVGRLDYQTTGLILLTNDGDFAQRLAHPKYEVTKTYRATLNTNLKQSDLTRLKNGVLLEDGPMRVDDIYYDQAITNNKETNKNNNQLNNNLDYKNIVVKIHSGKNRIVRRLFEHFGYLVVKLDRINYAGLTKQGLKVGSWRFLTDNEVAKIKQASF